MMIIALVIGAIIMFVVNRKAVEQISFQDEIHNNEAKDMVSLSFLEGLMQNHTMSGPISEESISISNTGKFAVFHTSQGGGTALFMYDEVSNSVHLVEGIHQGGGYYTYEWNQDDILRTTFTNPYGPEETVYGPYVSIDNKTPWILKEL